MKYKFSFLLVILCFVQINKALSITTITARDYVAWEQWAKEQNAKIINVNAYLDSNQQILDRVWQIINNQFFSNNLNSRQWSQTRRKFLSKNYATKEEAYQAARAMLQTLNDPETRIINSRLLANIQMESEGKSQGIGLIDFSVEQNKATKELRVVTAIADSPAAQAGLQPLDIIQAIDGFSTKQLTHDEAMTRLRGQERTQVVLTVHRNGKTFDLPINRQAISLQPVRAIIKQERGRKIGYIVLSQFTPNATGEMKKAIKTLLNKKVDGIILDLRNNPGGLLNVCTDIASLFLNKQRVGFIQTRKTNLEEIRASGEPLTNKLMVVLVNQGTASASEVLAAALQENNRAVLVGTNTYGRGRVHTGEKLFDDHILLFPVGALKTPTGKDIHNQGIQPNYTSTSKDSQYQQAINILIRRLS